MNHRVERDRIFVSYRRFDSAAEASLLCERLRAAFGEQHVFQDVEIDLGTPFPDALRSELDHAAILLVLIGRTWLAAQDEYNRRRIDLEDDWVRIEIGTGLAGAGVVIPLLVDDTSLPPAEALPAEIAALSDRQSHQIRINRWRDDIAALVAAISRETGWSTETQTSPRGGFGGVEPTPSNSESGQGDGAARFPQNRRDIRVFGSPPNVAADFIDRTDQLARLESTDSPVVTAFHGIGGVGKSQLAAHYFRTNQSRYDFASWIDMRLQRGRTDYANIAKYLALEIDGEDPIKVVRGYLNGTDERWLLVFDNADSPQDVESLRPDNPGAVKTIVTSRYRHWSGYAEAVPVDVFTPGQAAEYLGNHTGRANEPGTEVLAHALGYLPLALTIAGSYCLRARLPFATYVADYLPFHLDPVNPSPDSSDHAIHELWQQSLAAANERDPEAAPVAWLLSVLDWSSINREWLVAHHPAGKVRLTEILALLHSYSLIDLTDTAITITHNLIAKGLNYSANTAEIENLLESVFAHAVPALDDAKGDLNTAGRYREPIRHLEHLSLNHPHHITAGLAPILNRAVRQQRFQEPQFAEWPEIVDQVIRALLGPDHPDTFHSRNNLAISYRNVGRHDEALTLYEQNLSDRARILGPDHPDTFHSRHNLAWSYNSVGRHDEALALNEQNLNDRARILGPDHPNTLQSRGNLARSYRNVGRHDEALALNEQNLNDHIRILGPSDHETLNSRNNLARSLCDVGRHGEALVLDEQNLNDHIRILGPDHPDTLNSRSNLARSLCDVGRHGEALVLDEQNLNDHIRILGPDHPDTLNSRSNLAASYRHIGRDEEADELETEYV